MLVFKERGKPRRVHRENLLEQGRKPPPPPPPNKKKLNKKKLIN